MVFERLAKPWTQKVLWVRFPVSPHFMEECDNGSQAVLKTVGVLSA